MSKPLRSGHLCAGLLGLIADHLAGHETVALSEINDYSVKIASKRFPGAVQLGDLHLIQPAQLNELKLDLLCAGWPCTSLSRIGSKGGMKEGSGEPSALIWPILNLIKNVATTGRPIPAVFLENVEDVVDSPDFPLVVQRLGQCGYHVAWTTSTCDRHIFLPGGQAYSLPHKRPRFWLLAVYDGLTHSDQDMIYAASPSHERIVEGKNWTTPTTRARGSRCFIRPPLTRTGQPSKTAGRLRDDLETQAFIEYEKHFGEGSSAELNLSPKFVAALMGVPPGFADLSVDGSAKDFDFTPPVVPGRDSGMIFNPVVERRKTVPYCNEQIFTMGNGQCPWQALTAYRHLTDVMLARQNH